MTSEGCPAGRAWLCLVLTAGCAPSAPDGDRFPRALDGALALLGSAPATDALWLSQLMLYADISAKRLAPDLRELTPAHALFSDAAEKRRWLRLPAGARIDSSVMDDWQLPVGSMAFKEFSLEGRRIETRLIARTGAGPRDYWMGAFVWNDGESDAQLAAEGESDARGSAHDVPSPERCGVCHNGEPGRFLGISAVQTPDLPSELLTHAVPAELTTAPATPARRALGYLHANCAHCHNPAGSARPDTDMDLRSLASESDPERSPVARTAIGRRLQRPAPAPVLLRVEPGAPERSGVLWRMAATDPAQRMPPLGAESEDVEGAALLRSWILSLDR